MVIRASSADQIRALLADLASDRAVVRDAAIARLTVIGARAGQPLAACVADRRLPPAARAAALRVLEATADPRGLGAGLAATDDPHDEVTLAAIDALRAHLRGPRGPIAVDCLTGIALDARRAAAVRAAAVRALMVLERSTIRPLLAALANDPVAALAAGGAATKAETVQDDAALIADAAEGRLPAHADALRFALAREGRRLPLPMLLAVVERVRDREQTLRGHERGGWMAARATAHLALARRSSRIALYDMRETLQLATEPVPGDFITALAAIGDDSCLAAIAAAYTATRGKPHEPWRGQLAEVFRAIVKRKKLTRRHAAVRKLEAQSPETLGALWATKGR